MIHSVFELGETLAREVMVPRTDMVFIERHKTLRQALSLGLRSGFSRIPVIGDNEDDVVGIVYLKDVAKRAFDHRDVGVDREGRVGHATGRSSSLTAARPTSCCKDMQARRTHIAVVVDEYGGVAGLVTIEDILEEIVGEIADEYDVDGASADRASCRTARSGSARGCTSTSWPSCSTSMLDAEDLEDVDTVGGLLAKCLGKVPIPGATVEACRPAALRRVGHRSTQPGRDRAGAPAAELTAAEPEEDDDD